MEYLESELRIAVASLPPLVRRAMSVALASGWYSIEPGGYESAAGVCPIVAAAKISVLPRPSSRAGRTLTSI